MPSFKGEYTHSIDSKGRVSFPAKLRQAVNPEANNSFTILRGVEKCLYLYPQDKWQHVEEQLAGINSHSRKGRIVLRNFLRSAHDINLDKQNRIPLPSQLTEWIELTDSVTFIGTMNRIELWNPDHLKKADEDITEETYEELFEEVMNDVPL